MTVTIKRGDKEATGTCVFEEDIPELVEKLVEELRRER